MSNDPFHDLFEQGVPRSASAASTRSTLNALTPEFHRAKSRRRARVSAVAAFAVLGTTGGAAALGVGPVAFDNGPRNIPNPVAGTSSSVVENPSETTTTLAPTTTVTTTVTTTLPDIVVPTTVPVDGSGIETSDQGSSDNNSSDNNSSDHGSRDNGSDSESDSGKSDSADNNSDAGHTNEPSDSHGAAGTPSSEPGHDPSSPPDPESSPSDPVAGPLTKSIAEGSATVDIGPNGLLLVGINPAAGMSYQVKTKPDTIDIQFHDLVSGDKLSALEFELVDGGITVKVDHPH